jgi:hypothetical protein
VEGARRASELALPYLEVRYEALSRRDATVLREVHQFCGIDVTESDCAGLYETYSFDRMAGADTGLLVAGEFTEYARARVEPEGFYRQGRVAGWRDDWTARERLVFDAAAGDLLVALGYERDHTWVADPMRSRLYRGEAVAAAAIAKAGRWLGRRGDQLTQRTPRP